MTKEFVPYELAVKLNKLEFDAPCLSYYTTDGNLERGLLVMLKTKPAKERKSKIKFTDSAE